MLMFTALLTCALALVEAMQRHWWSVLMALAVLAMIIATMIRDRRREVQLRGLATLSDDLLAGRSPRSPTTDELGDFHPLWQSLSDLHGDYEKRLRAEQNLAAIDQQTLIDPNITSLAERLLRHCIEHHQSAWAAMLLTLSGGPQFLAVTKDGKVAHGGVQHLLRLGTESSTKAVRELQLPLLTNWFGGDTLTHIMPIQGSHLLGWLLLPEATFATREALQPVTQRVTSAATFLAYRDSLNQRANYDELTGLPNRQLFRDRLDNAVLRSRRGGARGALMFIDLDRFKDINDSEGHAAGDDALKTIAQRLTGALRRTDAVARLGGDEFTVILEQVGDSSAVSTIAEQLISAVTLPITLPSQNQVRVSCSIGISIFPDDAADAETLLINADLAMYKVKDSGRDGYRFFSEDINDRAREHKDLEHRLRTALQEQAFFLVYQPKVHLGSGEILGVEGLLRWHDRELGNIAPARFLPIAEDTGLIVELGRWVARNAANDFQRWAKLGIAPHHVAINVSPRQFQHPAFIDEFFDTLNQAGLDPRHIEIDITEQLLAKTQESTWQHLSRLRWSGARISLDDFGTGHSSMRTLRQLPIDTIKIDRSLVREIPENRDAEAIVRAVVAMSKALGKDSQAEGVETAEQARFLREIGCSSCQGNFFSTPLTKDETTAFLTHHASNRTAH